MDESLKKYQTHLICISLALAAFVAFEPILHNGFITFDDDIYVYNCPDVATGLTTQNVIRAFMNVHANNYHPITTLSHILDCQFYKLKPAGHHLTNLVFHIANTMLLFLFLSMATEKVWPAAFVAALFALHPMHVESVAWASERKDVLSTFFGLLTMLAYWRYTERTSIRRYFLTLALFALGLFSKPMLVTLPFVLLLLDYWPLKRFEKIKFGRLVFEKIPFFILSAITCLLTFAVQLQMGLVKTLNSYQFQWRINNAIVSYAIYIKKMFWPTNLAIFYPHHYGNIASWQLAGSFFVLLVITMLALWQIRRRPYIIVGWLWFLGTLVPVIGILQVGLQAYADRYTYIPYIGLFISITWGIVDLTAKLKHKKQILSVCAGLLLFAFGIKTYIQTLYWNNNLLLYSHAVSVVKDNWWAYSFLGKAWAACGKYDKAIEQYKIATKLDPENATVWYEMAKLYLEKGDVNEATIMYQKLLPPLPEDLNSLRGADTLRNEPPIIRALYVNANINYAGILAQQGDCHNAERRFKEALRMAPNAKGAQEGLEKLKKQKSKSTSVKDANAN